MIPWFKHINKYVKIYLLVNSCWNVMISEYVGRDETGQSRIETPWMELLIPEKQRKMIKGVPGSFSRSSL